MSLLRRLMHRDREPVRGGPGHQSLDNLERAEGIEGQMDPNTAALSEGAPPAGADGRIQPSGTSPDPRPPRGPSEEEVQNLPG